MSVDMHFLHFSLEVDRQSVHLVQGFSWNMRWSRDFMWKEGRIQLVIEKEGLQTYSREILFEGFGFESWRKADVDSGSPFVAYLMVHFPNQWRALMIAFLNNNNQRQSTIVMPKHQGPIQRLIDPFSIPAQMNNLGVLIVAYVTKDMYDQSQCTDPEDVKFLNFIYYGSTIVCGGTFLMSLIYMIGLLDYCINKVMPCGEVCLTLNTLTIFLAGIAYHCVATVYGLLEMFWGSHSKCIEIEMFKRITCTIYLIWFLCILAYLVFNIFIYNKKKQLQTVDQQYIQM